MYMIFCGGLRIDAHLEYFVQYFVHIEKEIIALPAKYFWSTYVKIKATFTPSRNVNLLQ